MPHLVNLSDDPLLAECLVYNIKPGTTTVGNVENASTSTEIRLNGSKIMRDHCTFENNDGFVTIIPRVGAAVMVNGLRTEEPKRLRSGNRIILGDFHIFRFNHPQEARAERKEQSLLRHSVAVSQLGSPGQRPAHSRAISRVDLDSEGDSSRPESPQPSKRSRDSDWSYARREAASAILGTDQKISHLTDDELDSLFDDVQRVRAVRKGRPESRLWGPEEEDSVSSYPHREKYMSNATSDVSLDTNLTLPGSPLRDDSSRDFEEDRGIESDGERSKSGRKDKEASIQDPTDLQTEKEHIEDALQTARADFQLQLEKQQVAFNEQLQKAIVERSPRMTDGGFTKLSSEEKSIAQAVTQSWHTFKPVKLTETVFKYATVLKEAQVMSQEMGKNVSFQFTVIAVEQATCSSYDLVLLGISSDDDLEDAVRPCVAIRVMDFRHQVIHLWAMDKLLHRLREMRQMHQYLSRPDYSQHFRLEDPFTESCLPQYSLLGEATIPLAAVFEARVHDFSVEIVSNYTFEAVGVIKLSLEPSSAQAPSSVIKFNVVMHDMVGFAEHEGTHVHAQLSIPGVDDNGGASSTQMINGFNEDPIKFDSIHSMSLPLDSKRSTFLLVSVFAKVTPMHMEKLLSWDEMRESAEQDNIRRKQNEQGARLAESEFFRQEPHDIFAKVKILEMSEAGEYVPVDVEQVSNVDVGTYQLRQGLQRRIIVNLAYSSAESLQWKEIKSMRVGNLRLFDIKASIPQPDRPNADISLRLIQKPHFLENGNGMKELTVSGQWDSSLHGSSLLDRPTADNYHVQMSLSGKSISSYFTALFPDPEMCSMAST
ncbi:MAG: hypothetical protein Q9221_004241 [Calogaya cf. arnoldii]